MKKFHQIYLPGLSLYKCENQMMIQLEASAMH